MRRTPLLVLVLMLCLMACSGIAWAARVHGDVYDLSLDRLSNVVIEVNTTPQQRVVSQNGSYSFTLPIGYYSIRAFQYQGSIVRAKAEENVSVVDEGDYVIDLFLYPNLDVVPPTNTSQNQTGKSSLVDNIGLLIILVIVIAGGTGLALYLARANRSRATQAPKPIGTQPEVRPEQNQAEKAEPKAAAKQDSVPEAKPRVDEDLSKVIEILKAEGGRSTQKEIRKHLPLSEAKVSLIITEMEAKGIIEKIKKGRGNIIILKKSD